MPEEGAKTPGAAELAGNSIAAALADVVRDNEAIDGVIHVIVMKPGDRDEDGDREPRSYVCGVTQGDNQISLQLMQEMLANASTQITRMLISRLGEELAAVHSRDGDGGAGPALEAIEALESIEASDPETPATE